MLTLRKYRRYDTQFRSSGGLYVSFHVKEKEFVAIMGASGSGKTTLLNCISTIDTPTGGNVLVEGVDITKLSRKDVAHFRREKLGFIFQDFKVADRKSVVRERV